MNPHLNSFSFFSPLLVCWSILFPRSDILKPPNQTRWGLAHTCAQKQDIINPTEAADPLHGDLSIVRLTLHKEWLAPYNAVHQKMILEVVEHSVWHLERRRDLHLARVAGDALWRDISKKEQS